VSVDGKIQFFDQQGNRLYLNGEEHEGPLLAVSSYTRHYKLVLKMGYFKLRARRSLRKSAVGPDRVDGLDVVVLLLRHLLSLIH